MAIHGGTGRAHRARANQAHIERDLDRHRPAAQGARGGIVSRSAELALSSTGTSTSRPGDRLAARDLDRSAGDNAATAIRGGAGSVAALVHQAHVERDPIFWGRSMATAIARAKFRQHKGRLPTQAEIINHLAILQ